MSLAIAEPLAAANDELTRLLAEGVSWQQRNDRAKAMALYTQVLAQDPQHAGALHMMGALAFENERYDFAAQLFALAHASAPDDPQILNNLGSALIPLARADEALPHFERAIALAPGAARTWSNQSRALLALGRVPEALDSIDRAIALEPGWPELLSARADCLVLLGRDDEALAAQDQAIALCPWDPGLYQLKAGTLNRIGRPQEAIACCDRAMALSPQDGRAAHTKGMLLVSLGDFENGWPLFERRYDTPTQQGRRRALERPLWSGDTALDGRTVLLYNDAGLGDALMFARYVPLVAALGGKVIVEAQPALVPLLAQLGGVHACVPRGQPLPDFDLNCPMFSLPMALKTRLDTVPSPQGYLRSLPERDALWAQRLGPRNGRLRVGLVWSGLPQNTEDRNRSMTLERFAQALPPGLDYFSLQAVVRPVDQPALAARPWIRDFTGELHDFADTASLAAQMDLVVTVDTSVAHLAGGMGLPTWVVLPDPAPYCWMREREDSPWYASARLWRQGPERGWGPVLARVREGLVEMAALR